MQKSERVRVAAAGTWREKDSDERPSDERGEDHCQSTTKVETGVSFETIRGLHPGTRLQYKV